MSGLCGYEQLRLDHIKAQVETHKKNKPLQNVVRGQCNEREGDVCPIHARARSVSSWKRKKSQQSSLKSTLRTIKDATAAPALSGS